MLELIERIIPKKPWMKDYSFVLVQSIEQLEEIINRAIKADLCSFDLESTGLDTRILKGRSVCHVVGYSLSFEPKIGYYIPIRHEVETESGHNIDPEKTNALIQKLILEAKSIVGHNWLKFDSEMLLSAEGIDLRDVGASRDYPYHDTYMLARLAGKNPARLKYLSENLIGKEMLEITDVVDGKEINFASIKPAEGLLYAASDAICTYELFFHPDIQEPLKTQGYIYTVERKLAKVVRRMERNKTKLNKVHCEKLNNDLLNEISELEKSIFAEVAAKTEGRIKEFKLDSPDDVSNILFEVYDMNPKPERGKKGNYTTNDETLERLSPKYPFARKIQEYRTATKFHRTYIVNMLKNVDDEGYLKFNFSQLKTDSGRFASPGKSEDSKINDGYSGVNIQCLEGNTRILIKNKGYVKISSVAGQDVEIWDGSQFVKAKCVSSGKKQKVVITFYDNQQFICSPDHRFLVQNEEGYKEEWRTSLNFRKREYVSACYNSEPFDSNFIFKDDFKPKAHNAKIVTLNSIKNKYDLGVILGRFASDGTLTKNKRVEWIVAEHEYNILPYLESVLKNLGKYWKKIALKKGFKKDGTPYKELTHICFSSAYLAKQINDLNLKWDIPDIIFSSKELLRGFLCGYVDGDGGATKSKTFNGVSISFGCGNNKELLEPNYQYAKLLQKGFALFNIFSSVRKFSSKVVLTITRSSEDNFIKEIGFLNNKKKEILLNCKFSKKLTKQQRNVKSVKKVDITDEYIEMYDIVGCLHQRFIADGLIVHNSTPARYDKTKPNVRKCISCEDDEVICALDWSGVEIRVAANMSKEPIWLDRFLNGDGDLHTSTASIIFDKPESEISKEERQTGKCVDPDSLAYINGKYTRFGNLFDKREEDTFYNIEDKAYFIKISDTANSKIKNFYSNGITERLMICFRRGVLVCSKNHRVELKDGTLVKAKDIVPGMILKEITYGLESENKIKELPFNPFLKTKRENDSFFIKINKDLAYVAGLFLGDGMCSKNTCSICTGGKIEYAEWREIVKSSLQKIGLIANIGQEQIHIKTGGSDRKIYFGSRYTVSVFQQLELINENYKRNLKVPSFILNGDFESKLSFLGGLIDTDGCVGKGGNIEITTKSWVFAQDLCVLLASCNFHYSLEPTYNKKYNKHYFRIRLGKLNNKFLRSYIKCPWKIDRATDPVFQYNKFPENIITKVIPIENSNLVDVEIESEEHIYMVNNIRTHNTFNFQTVYGGGPGALSTALSISYDDAKNKQEKYFGRLKTLKTWIKDLQRTAEKKGFCLTSFGRKRMLPEFKSEIPKIRANASRKAINTPVQGGAADLLKIAMIFIDRYIEENNLEKIIHLLITMHDELVFRVKKVHIDIIRDIEKVMRLDGIIKKIGWEVPLQVDVEVGSSWDVEYEYPKMLQFLKESKGVDKVSYIYEKGVDYNLILKEYKEFCDNKKKEKENAPKENKNVSSKEEFKKVGTEIQNNFLKEELKIVEEEKKEVVPAPEKEATSETVTATANELDNVFKVLKAANLSDLPLEAYEKLKKSFYEEEFKRLMSGTPSTLDCDIEFPIIIHNPIDAAKSNMMGFVIESCPGNGKIKFLTQDKEELHEDWIRADVIKVAVMCGIFNL